MRPGQVRSLDLILTTRCNLSCRYCYQTVRRRRRMDWEIIQASIDLLLSSPHRQVDLLFVGGEPLLEFPAIQAAVDYAERNRPADKRFKYKISTNGTLVTDEIAAFLAEHRFYTQLSFDGVRAAQAFRDDATFETLDRLLTSLRKEHPRFYHTDLVAAVTLIPPAVRYLADSVEYFLVRGVSKIAITPSIMPYPGWAGDAIDELDAQFSRIFESSLRHLERTGEVPLVLFRDGEERRATGDTAEVEPSTRTASDSRFVSGATGAEGDPPSGSDAGRVADPRSPAGTRMMCRIVPNVIPCVDVDGRAYHCGLFAESMHEFRSPLLGGCLATMCMGDIRDPEFHERNERFHEAVGGLPIFACKERKRSTYGRCADCRHFDVCAICPVSIGYMEGNDDPDRVPDFYCAYNLVSLDYRNRFPVRPSLRQRVLGEPYRDEMERWGVIARAVRKVRETEVLTSAEEGGVRGGT
jgi:MoaA/NifB/PqqE/SkfB family radical SAM enzyme